jgi:hypothetical protein
MGTIYVSPRSEFLWSKVTLWPDEWADWKDDPHDN